MSLRSSKTSPAPPNNYYKKWTTSNHEEPNGFILLSFISIDWPFSRNADWLSVEECYWDFVHSYCRYVFQTLNSSQFPHPHNLWIHTVPHIFIFPQIWNLGGHHWSTLSRRGYNTFRFLFHNRKLRCLVAFESCSCHCKWSTSVLSVSSGFLHW